MIVGLVSSYCEGQLGRSAVASLLQACDSVLVAEGPIGDQQLHAREDWRAFGKTNRVTVGYGQWASDADKRTHLLQRAKQRRAKWGVILDADELLIWGEYLRDSIAYLEAVEAETGEIQMGHTLRRVEHDGSCSAPTARIVRLEYVERYVLSSMTFLLTNGVEVTRADVPLLLAGEPDSADLILGIQRRRPLHGEPHILHRAFLRPPSRQGARLHKAEEADLHEMMRRQGLTPFEKAKPDGVPIYLPEHMT